MAKILIIDDDPVYSDMTKQRLERGGHEVTVHSGPFGATAAADDPSLDLIILDVFMPALPGPDLLEIMRKNAQNQPAILFYSSMDPAPLAQLASEHGAQGYVSKSAARDKLLGAVQSAIASRRKP